MFSVIIPVHNKLPHLDRSIYSVLNQTFKDFELIIIDDASSDGSEEKIKEYNDYRIRILKRDIPGPGGYAARNLGIKEAKFERIAFLDADDEWKVNYLEEIDKAFGKYPKSEVISTGWVYSTDNIIMKVPGFKKIKNQYKEFTLIDYFNYNLIVWTSAVVIKKELLLKSGLFPEGKCRRSGDMDTWIRCLNDSNKNIFINKELAIYYRDTVNRVTNFSNNPALEFCPLDTIVKIQSGTNDKKLLRAMDDFCEKHLLSRMIKMVRKNNHFNKKDINIILSKKKKYKLLAKVYFYQLLFNLKIK